MLRTTDTKALELDLWAFSRDAFSTVGEVRTFMRDECATGLFMAVQYALAPGDNDLGAGHDPALARRWRHAANSLAFDLGGLSRIAASSEPDECAVVVSDCGQDEGDVRVFQRALEILLANTVSLLVTGEVADLVGQMEEAAERKARTASLVRTRRAQAGEAA